MTPVITAEQLMDAGVCNRWRAKLYRMFGPEIPVTLATCVEHAEDIDWDEAVCLLSGEHRARHMNRCSVIMRMHERAAVVYYRRLHDEIERLRDIVIGAHTTANEMNLPLSDRRKVNRLAAFLHSTGLRAAVAEFHRDAAAFIMLYNVRVATSFCTAYTSQWTKAGAT